MTDHAGAPREGLPGLKLLVWPEQASKHRPWLSEGPGNGQRVDLPLRVPGTSHLYGLVTRQEKSIQNSLLAADLGLPIVRVSVFGQAAIIDRTGKVLAVSKPGTSEILARRS